MDDIQARINEIESFLHRDAAGGFEGPLDRLIDGLEEACAAWPPPRRQPVQRGVSELRGMFAGFDRLDGKDRAQIIGMGLALLDEMKERLSRRAGPPEDGGTADAHDPREALRAAFVKLSQPARYVKGVGPKIARLLEKKGLKTVEDMIYFLPRKYEDRRSVRRISEAELGRKETVVGTVRSAAAKHYGRRRLFEVQVEDGSGFLTAKWFHGSDRFLRTVFERGRRVIFTGEVRGFLFEKEMIHPDFEVLDEDEDALLHFKRIVPVYSETEGLGQKNIRRIMMHVVDDFIPCVASPIPPWILRRQGLQDIREALRSVHFPDGDSDVDRYNAMRSEAHRRIIFDEFFFFELGMALRKRGSLRLKGIPMESGGALLGKWIRMLPFELTAAQKRVIGEISGDMRRGTPMNRLLQGDVGSGKTAVAVAAMIAACENGCQAAIMAPTEILAEQHFAHIRPWSQALGLETALLTGSVKSAERTSFRERIADGKVNLVVGTHALIQEGVQFRRLGMVVIDEQHRFGVVQRALLRGKGENPHVLVMTATPIPRTLAMTVYGDLDVSVIDEMPPGKKPVRTKIFYEKDRRRVYEIIRKEMAKGHQVFTVYPLVEESEKVDLKDATKMTEHLQKDIFPEFSVGLVHGRLKAPEKDAIMDRFRKKRIDLLVATTVIEVGIDIPAASLMVIEHAERFGLAQLHQLRGRVGRGDIPSYCILLTDARMSDHSARRLRVMEETNDGFRIAEEDLAIRGPGEFLGTRQSGLPDFRVANILRDTRVLSEARKEAFGLVEKDPLLEGDRHGALREVLFRRWEGRLDLARTA